MSFTISALYISLLFLISLLSYNKDIFYDEANYSNDVSIPAEYIKLVHESFNIVPDVYFMLSCLRSLRCNNNINLFYKIDSIRLLSKAMRLQNFTKMLNKNDGDISAYYNQMQIYMNRIILANKLHRIKNICEIGFQVGAGALTLLMSINSNLTYYGFDYGKKYSRECYNIIKYYFNMNMIWGKSETTIKTFNNITCNVIHIDGDHKQTSIYNDIKNMKMFSDKNTLIFLDDVNIGSESIEKAKEEMIINTIECFKWKPFCICKYSF